MKGIKWRLIFGIKTYTLWSNGNRMGAPKEVLKVKKDGCWDKFKKISQSVLYMVGGVPSSFRFVKFHVDGKIDLNIEKSSWGGIIRNQHGDFMRGFATNIERCSVIEAKL